MPSSLGRYIVSQFLPPANPLVIETGVNWEYIRIINNSPYLLGLNFEGVSSIDFPEMFLEDILLYPQYRGKIVVSPVANLLNTGQAISNLLSVTAYAHGELSSPQSQPLTQQAVSTTASGKPLFSATFGIGTSAGTRQAVNVFNPANSGVTMTFHSARAITNETTIPTASLVFQAGADLNLPIAASAVSHDGNANPRVSVAHVTARDDNVALGGTAIETLQMAASVLVDALLFPDQVTLAPGNNLFMGIVSSTTGHNVRISMKWEEG